MKVKEFFDPQTFTLTYVVSEGADAVIIDPVLDYDPASSRTTTTSIDKVLEYVAEQNLRVHFALETHAHADHLSAAQIVNKRLGAKLAIGARITEVQKTFQRVFDLPKLETNGAQFDRLLAHGEVLQAGALSVRVLATPGHTPACVSYAIGDAVFTGDALFIEDYGTGRTDFPGGSADDLYRSIHEVLYALPPETRVFVGHDYQPGGRAVRSETTIAASRAHNVHLRAGTTHEQFVALRRDRDRGLNAPRLLYPSVQVNIDGGRLPPRHENGTRYLAVPIGGPKELD